MRESKEYLQENPKYIEPVRDILEWEEDNPQEDDSILEGKEHDRRWESTDVGVHSSKLYQLVLAGIVEKVYDSNSRTEYALVDRNATRQVLNELDLVEEQGLKVVEHDFPDSDELPDNLFDDVIGYDDVKWLLRRGLSTDSITNFLLVGPPGSAKTVFLMCIARMDDAEFIPATRASSAGFTEVLFQSQPKFMLFDELDDMDTDEQKSLSSYTETGVVRETMYDKQRKMKINTKTIASANSTDSILDHIVDRFTVLNFEPYEKDEYMEVCRHILPKDEGVTESEADTIARGIWAQYGTGDVRQAIQVARLSDGDPERVIRVLDEYSTSTLKSMIG